MTVRRHPARAALRPRARRRLAVVLGLAVVATLGVLAAPRPSAAGTEEWSSFDVEHREEDNKSMLDMFLARPQLEWQDEWDHAAQGFRTEQGCVTSGKWIVHSDLKTHSALGKRAWLGIQLRQVQDDVQDFDYLDIQAKFPIAHWGTPGAWFRPLPDKSAQDFAFTWEVGADTTAEQLQLAFTLEDVFNNLWAFRQTQVGGLSEPYERRPYEPGIHWASRHDAFRVDVAARYLTPSRKRVIDFGDPVPERHVTLWGTLADASIEARWLGATFGVATHNQQANSTDQAIDLSDAPHRYFRREWRVDASARRVVYPRVTFETHYIYQERDAVHGPPVGPSFFGALDRMGEGELRWNFHPGWIARVGGMYDRIDVAQAGSYRVFTYGTRNASRVFLGLVARVGRVDVAGIEGIGLDPLPYPTTWWHHDKGFLQMQTTF